jgi:hypothetical protein
VTDAELTGKIASLEWEVDLEAGTVKSDLLHYTIIPGDGYNDLKMTWASPDLPPVITVLDRIQRGAVSAFMKENKKRKTTREVAELCRCGIATVQDWAASNGVLSEGTGSKKVYRFSDADIARFLERPKPGRRWKKGDKRSKS